MAIINSAQYADQIAATGFTSYSAQGMAQDGYQKGDSTEFHGKLKVARATAKSPATTGFALNDVVNLFYLPA